MTTKANNAGISKEGEQVMCTKSKAQVSKNAEVYPRKNISVLAGPTDDEKGRAYAGLITAPEYAACQIIRMMQTYDTEAGIDVPMMLATLRDQAGKVQSGDMSQPEAMLMNQASALQSLFVHMVEKARWQEHMPSYEGFMRMALRAQSQSRATLETLSAIKNPPVVYAKQANVTTGPQQINNCADGASRTREIKTEQTQLLEKTDGERLDGRTKAKTGKGNPEVETLGTLNRAKDC